MVVISKHHLPSSKIKEIGKKRDIPEGPYKSGPLSKKPRSRRDGKDSRTATSNKNVFHQMFAKMGHQNASEANVHSCYNASLDESVNATTKGHTKLFIRQASHSKELKSLARDNTILKFKAT